MKFKIREVGHKTDASGYEAHIDGKILEVCVTHSPKEVGKWVKATEEWNDRRLHRLLVGVDTEWCRDPITQKKSHIAAITLIVSKRCLIYQLRRGNNVIPETLKTFFDRANYKFLGLALEKTKIALQDDYSVIIKNTEDVALLASEQLNDPRLAKLGIIKVAERVLGKDFENDRLKQAMTDWEKPLLTHDQVMYAVKGAYLSFETGRVLQVWYD